MATELAKTTGTEQIEMMKSLSQQAAGWLVGLTARSLRDHPELARNADGSYDAQQLLASPLVPSGTLPAENSDEAEKVTQIADWLAGAATMLHSEGSMWTVVALMESLRQRHGNAGLAWFAALALECWKDCASAWKREPTDSEIHEKLEKEFHERLEREQVARQRRLFRVAFVCQYCRKIRRGLEWFKGRAPMGFIELESVCPNCAFKPGPKNLDLSN